MIQLYHELAVLSKAVQFKNLSAAALHVGLSQPQLSRIIAKLEDELKIVLLDRSAKRKSGWTPLAFRLAKLYESSAKNLEAEIVGISNNEMVAELHVGTLEGLSSFAIKICQVCFKNVGVKIITLDSLDLNELEANFLSGNLDLVLTSKSPGRQKFSHLLEIGYQHMELISTDESIGVFSTFEYGRRHKKDLQSFEHIFVSNNLAIKTEWLNEVGGLGTVPSPAVKGKSKNDEEPVLLIGSETLSPILWEQIEAAVDSLI